jgi:FkbM family methyltransferase
MFRLATSPLAPMLGQHVPVRGPARLLHRSYGKAAARLRQADQARPAGKVLTTAAGDVFQVDLASFLEWQLWAFGSFEAYVAQLFPYLVRDGDRCVDVGANVGVHAVRLGKLAGPAGEVIAFEPDLELSRRAAANVALNGLANVRVVQAAASDRSGDRVSLFRATAQDTNRARASLLRHAYLTGPAQEVETVTIDQACPGQVALIKIDVEGYEAAVVAGAAQTIARYSPAIVFEYAPELLTERSQCPFEQLADSGYEMFRIRHHRNPLTGRGAVELERLSALPLIGGDLLAVSADDAPRIGALVRAT